MKRLLALLAGGLGLGAALHRRRRQALELGPSPADDLRSKLAETRNLAEPPPPAVEGSQPPTHETPTADLDSRRQDVHDRARGAIDELS